MDERSFGTYPLVILIDLADEGIEALCNIYDHVCHPIGPNKTASWLPGGFWYR